MTVLAGAIIAPSLPGMNEHFGGDAAVAVQLVLTMPALMITLFSPAMGYLADRFGRRNLLLAALLVYGVAGLSGFLIDRIDLLILSRAILGIAVAGIISISTTLIGDYFNATERARFLGLQGSFMALGGVVFLNLGGALADWSWRGPFLVYIAGLILLPYARAMLHEPAVSSEEDDDNAAQLIAEPFPWGRVSLAYSLGLISMAMFYMVPAQLPFLLTEHHEVSATAIGLALSTTPMAAAIVSFTYGRLKPWITVSNLYVIGFVLVTIGFTIVGYAHSYSLTLAGVSLAGLGFGIFLPNTNVWLMRITPLAYRGRVFGGSSSAIFLGQFLSPLVVAPVATLLGSLREVYLAAAVLCLSLALIMAMLGVSWLRHDDSLARPQPIND